jgi:hypothetical protein
LAKSAHGNALKLGNYAYLSVFFLITKTDPIAPNSMFHQNVGNPHCQEFFRAVNGTTAPVPL